MHARRTQPTLTACSPVGPLRGAWGAPSWKNLHTLTPMHARRMQLTLTARSHSRPVRVARDALSLRARRTQRTLKHAPPLDLWVLLGARFPLQEYVAVRLLCEPYLLLALRRRIGREPPVTSPHHHPTPVHMGRASGAACRPSRLRTRVRHRRPRRPAHASPAAVPDQQRDPGAVPGLYAWLAPAARCCGPGGRALTRPTTAFCSPPRFMSLRTAACGPRSPAGLTARP